MGFPIGVLPYDSLTIDVNQSAKFLVKNVSHGDPSPRSLASVLNLDRVTTSINDKQIRLISLIKH